MAESEQDLGNIQTLLQQVLSEIQNLKYEIRAAGLEGSHKSNSENMPILWYDKLPRGIEVERNWASLPKNTLHRKNKVCLGMSDMPDLYNRLGIEVKLKDIREWDESYANKNNLYYVEMTQVHEDLSCVFDYIDPVIFDLIRGYKLAVVWWFPHEGFGLDAMRSREDKGWMERLVEGLEKHDIAYGNHFFVFNDLNIEDNFKRWFNARPDLSFKFKKVFGYNFFHYLYYQQFMGRTTWRYDPITEIEGFSEFTSYGDWESPNDRDCYILASDIPSENLSGAQRYYGHDAWRGHQVTWRGTRRDIVLDEVMNEIPQPEMKNKDLICLNARPRSHRPVVVSELHRLGYNNENSYISFLCRDEVRNEDTGYSTWKDRAINNASIEEFSRIVDNHVTHIMETKEQKEFFYKFWKRHDIITCGDTTQEIDFDDRKIGVEMYQSAFFAFITETLFGDYGETHSLQLTEKIYKPIAYRTPFIVAGSAGTLKHLRSLGYETFPEMFDETYDTVVNPRKRMTLILRELEKWRALTLDQKRERYQSVLPKLARNYNHFLNSVGVQKRELQQVLENISL